MCSFLQSLSSLAGARQEPEDPDLRAGPAGSHGPAGRVCFVPLSLRSACCHVPGEGDPALPRHRHAGGLRPRKGQGCQGGGPPCSGLSISPVREVQGLRGPFHQQGSGTGSEGAKAPTASMSRPPLRRMSGFAQRRHPCTLCSSRWRSPNAGESSDAIEAARKPQTANSAGLLMTES